MDITILKQKLSIIKLKKVYIPLVIVLVTVGLWYRSYSASNAPIQYDTVKAITADLVQKVEATGKIEAVEDLGLKFESSGIVADVKVKANDMVKAGDWLANLRLNEYNASVAQAAANLNQKLAGPSIQDRQYYEAAADSAKASWEQSIASASNLVSSAESAVESAKNNMKLAEGGENSQIVSNAYESAVAALQSSLVQMDNGLTQSDNILGVDNALGNDAFESYLAILNSSLLSNAKSDYLLAKNVMSEVRPLISVLNGSSPRDVIDKILPQAENALLKVVMVLSDTSNVLGATPPVGVLTQSTLDSYKTSIESARASVNTQYTTLIGKRQGIGESKNSYLTYSIAYQKALKDLDEARVTADASVAIKKAAYDQGLSTLSTKIDPPREVDIASYRAALYQASAMRDKAIIRAPIDGKITKVVKQKGESIMSSEVMVQLSSPHYEVKLDIPETDIPKISIGDSAVITLDAFGDEVKLSGKVLAMELASTEIQDVVYYRVTITVDPSDKEIKSGMTANVSLSTDSRTNVLAVPVRAIKTNNGKKIQILENGKMREVDVQLGMRADDGRVEILSGLSAGQDVIIGVKAK